MANRKEPELNVPLAGSPQAKPLSSAKPEQVAADAPAVTPAKTVPPPVARASPPTKPPRRAIPLPTRKSDPRTPPPKSSIPPPKPRLVSVARVPPVPPSARTETVTVTRMTDAPPPVEPVPPPPKFRTIQLATTGPAGDGGTSSNSLVRAQPPSPPARKSPWARPLDPMPEIPAAAARPAPAPPPAHAIQAEPAPSAPPAPLAQSLADLPPVSASDWVQKVGESARKVDVVVVFHSIAHSGSDAFQFAFRTMMQEVLPRLGRPYVAYRFSLDAEPTFVTEMAECLGLPANSAVTGAGILWSGPRRRLSLIGDRAFQSRSAFSRFLQETLASQQARLPSGILSAAGAPVSNAPRPRTPAAAPAPAPPKSAARRRLTAAALMLVGTLVAVALLASTVFDWRPSPPISQGPVAPAVQPAPAALTPDPAPPAPPPRPPQKSPAQPPRHKS